MRPMEEQKEVLFRVFFLRIILELTILFISDDGKWLQLPNRQSSQVSI